MNIGIRSILAAAMLLPALANAAKVTGTVTDRSSGDPIAGARVIIASFNGGAAGSDTATTDAKGAYAFDSVSTGFKSVVASKDGFQPNTANANVVQAGGSYTANISLVPAPAAQTGAISGTVKDDSTKEAIKGATVILSHPAGRGGATPIDTVLSDGEGRFFFPAVTAANGYIVTATAAGYSEAANNNVNVANRDTATVALSLKRLPKPNATIYGVVSDAGTKSYVNYAVVVLRKRSAGSATWVNVDTTTSGPLGMYRFAGLESSTLNAPYSIVVTMADYNTATTGNIVVANGQTDTVNIALAKIAKGSMSVYVGRDTTGNPALAGADIVATLDGTSGTLYTGTTDAKGWVTFPSVIAGNYSVSANLSGFVSKVVARTVSADEKDTGFIYLARATTQNSKSLSGLVRDADGKAIAGAKVLFEGNGNNGITLSATTTATGDYSFNGIPTNVASGTVTVTKDGYAAFSSPVTLSGQASFLNVTLKVVVGIARAGMTPERLGLIRDGRELSAVFAPAAVSGSLSLFDARGARLGIWTVPAGAMRASLGQIGSTRAAFMVLRQGALVQNLALPH